LIISLKTLKKKTLKESYPPQKRLKDIVCDLTI